MSKKLFLTGEPGAGKTTVFQKVITEKQDDCVGFYTSEILQNGARVGFNLIPVNLPIENGLLAHIDLKTDYQLSKYGVDITHLEKIIPVMKGFLNQKKFLIIDEIGKMEEFSQPFKDFIEMLLQSDEDLLATVKLENDPWRDHIKQNFNVPLLTATPENRNNLPKQIIEYFS